MTNETTNETTAVCTPPDELGAAMEALVSAGITFTVVAACPATGCPWCRDRVDLPSAA